MAGWYFSVNGRAEGPVSEAVLVDGLKSGRFTLVDLVFREGSAGWTTLGEIPEFRDAFEALPLPSVAPKISDTVVPQEDPTDEVTNPLVRIASTPKFEEPKKSTPPPAPSASVETSFKMPPPAAWVVLRKKGTGFEQLGPYTEEQILERIGSGDVEYSMYAWKPGYKRWVRIGNLPEFDRRKRDRENDPVNQVIPLPTSNDFGSMPSGHDLAKSVETFKRPEIVPARQEPPPLDAKGVDLVEANSPYPTPTPMPSFRIDNSPLEREQKNQKTKSETKLEKKPDFDPVLNPDFKPEPKFEMPPPVMQAAPTPVAPPPAHRPPPIEDADRTVVNRSPEVVHEITPEPQTAAGAVVEDDIEEAPKKKRSGLPFYQRAAIALVAAGFVVFGVLAAAQWWNVQKAKEQAAQDAEFAEVPTGDQSPGQSSAAQDPAPPTSIPTEQAAALDEEGPGDTAPSPATEPATPKQAAVNELGLRPIPPSPGGATVLEVVPMKLTTQTPILVFQTDANVGETIEVRLKAKAGDILKWVSFSNTYLVRRGNGEIPSLDLSKFDLPVGTYRVDASVGKIRKGTTIFLGVKDATFESERRDHMKNVSQIQQAEKKALFYSAQKLEKLADQIGVQAKKLKGQKSGAVAKWKKFYGDWRKQAKAAAKPALKYVKSDRQEMVAFPDLFLTFDQLNDELLEQAREVDASFTQKRGVANVPLPVARSFKKLRIDASKLTSQP